MHDNDSPHPQNLGWCKTCGGITVAILILVVAVYGWVFVVGLKGCYDPADGPPNVTVMKSADPPRTFIDPGVAVPEAEPKKYDLIGTVWSAEWYGGRYNRPELQVVRVEVYTFSKKIDKWCLRVFDLSPDAYARFGRPAPGDRVGIVGGDFQAEPKVMDKIGTERLVRKLD